MRPPIRTTVLVVLATLSLLTAGCPGGDEEATPDPTQSPAQTPAVESAGEFQLVATVEQAFVGERPAIDLPGGGEQTLNVTPAPAVEGRATAGIDGVMRVRVEQFSDPLRDRCAADAGDRFKLFWTTDTQFDRRLVSEDIEEILDGRRLGVIGTIFVSQSIDQENIDQLGLTAAPFSPSVTGSSSTPTSGPGVAAGEGETKCILVAQQVGSSTGVLTTAAPRTTRPPTATPFRTTTPAPTATPTPTPAPTPTQTPSPGPT
jgi:hypothetical protein